MKATANDRRPCEVCGKTFLIRSLVPGGAFRDAVAGEIRREYPGWSAEKFICQPDLNRFQARYVYSLLEPEKGELTSLEHEVLQSLREHEVRAKDTVGVRGRMDARRATGGSHCDVRGKLDVPRLFRCVLRALDRHQLGCADLAPGRPLSNHSSQEDRPSRPASVGSAGCDTGSTTGASFRDRPAALTHRAGGCRPIQFLAPQVLIPVDA